MRTLRAEGRGAHSGEYFEFAEVICDPTPVRRPGPPVLIGAPATPATFRRVARFGDGWLPVFVTPEQVGEGRAGIEITVLVKDASPRNQELYAAAGADRLVVQLYNHPGIPLPIDRWEEHHIGSSSAPPPAPEDTQRALAAVAGDAFGLG